MFDNVKFEGTINLGAICVALIQLISAYTVLVRVRALIEEKNIKLNIFSKKKPIIPPALPSNDVKNTDDQGASNQPDDEQAKSKEIT